MAKHKTHKATRQGRETTLYRREVRGAKYAPAGDLSASFPGLVIP